MRILLMQHGEAMPTENDPERRLTVKGRRDVTRVAQFLRAAGMRVSRVIHSGKERARETAEVLAEALMDDPDMDVSTMINPGDPVRPFAVEIRELATDTAIVGHLPFMVRMVSHLIAGDEEMGAVAFEPGSIVCLERTDEGGWSMCWMIRPSLLP